MHTTYRRWPCRFRIGQICEAPAGGKAFTCAVAVSWTTCWGSPTELELERERFDVVLCRFLLCRLQPPLDALREMRSLLQCGGLLVCEDGRRETIGTIPPTPAFAQVAPQL